MLTLGVFHATTIFQHCPYLYEKITYNTPEKYLDFLENRIIGWQFLLENPNEDQLNSFRSELLEYYEQIITKRGLFSIMFTDSVPYQPWALFKEEMNQHLTQLSSYKRNLSSKKDMDATYNNPLYSQYLLDKINKSEIILNMLKKCIQAWPTYQSECSQARQEVNIFKVYNFLNMFHCYYLANRLLAR
jgi:hypothetical protein